MDEKTEDIVANAIARMKSGAIKKEENKSMIIVTIIIAIILTLSMVFLTYDYYQNPRDLINDEGINEVVLEQNRQGHYLVKGSINSVRVDFIIDTGATTIAVPSHLQKTLGLKKGRSVWSNTANGKVLGYSSIIKLLNLGGIEKQNIRATILPNMDSNEILLGMSFLKTLKIVQEDKLLRISNK